MLRTIPDSAPGFKSAKPATSRSTCPTIDEVGHLSYSNRHADLLFNIVSSRAQKHATSTITNRPFAEWGEVSPHASWVVALVDRLVHHAEIVAIDGDSCRRKEAEERHKERSAERRRRRSAAATGRRRTPGCGLGLRSVNS